MEGCESSTLVSRTYIEENFEKADLLAAVLVNRYSGSVMQRLATARTFLETTVQDWLRDRNDDGYDVYLSMNALRAEATQRTKQDVATIRHIYLDFDKNGTSATEEMMRKGNLPSPSYLLDTSPDRWQVIWKVGGFLARDAEALQRSLSRQWGADPAATDCARVMRLPGFRNHKYEPPHWVGVKKLSHRRFTPADFPVPDLSGVLSQDRTAVRQLNGTSKNPPALSQSERDWAFAKRALSRGDAPEKVIAAIATYREGQKANARYYAEHTVLKAQQALIHRPIEKEKSTFAAPERSVEGHRFESSSDVSRLRTPLAPCMSICR